MIYRPDSIDRRTYTHDTPNYTLQVVRTDDEDNPYRVSVMHKDTRIVLATKSFYATDDDNAKAIAAELLMYDMVDTVKHIASVLSELAEEIEV